MADAMRVVVTGSIATDHLMLFPGRFADQLMPDQLHRVSLSFLVDRLEVRRGGIAANICFGMAALGLRPVLVGAVGADFDDYRSWLERHGVDTASVHVSQLQHTARFLCTTDAEQNQIASFYAGAMSEARLIELAPIAARLGGLDLVVISPNDPDAMLQHTDECRERGYPFVADPSQQLARMDGPQIRRLVEGAAFLFTNDYEKVLTETKTGWSDAEVLARVGVRVTTLGAKGAIVERAGEPAIRVEAVPEITLADPTGVGDAFRAGFLAGLVWNVGLERCAQIGSLLATYVLETVGTQEYQVKQAAFHERFAKHFGETAAGEIDHMLDAH
ncbi:MAG: adenosine kinase [Actinomycetota bacterium]|jgi:adenosine kinase|nr:adenosine kinase [Actinomycetota bacterium]